MKTCRTCPREAAPGLEHCADCINRRFFTPTPSKEPFAPEWRKRLTAKDLTDYGRAA